MAACNDLFVQVCAERDRLKAEVAVLKNAMLMAGIPSEPYRCECCGQEYYPRTYESCRCAECCTSCHKPKGASDWVRGKSCPKNKSISRCTSPDYGHGTYQCKEVTCPVHGDRNRAMAGG